MSCRGFVSCCFIDPSFPFPNQGAAASSGGPWWADLPSASKSQHDPVVPASLKAGRTEFNTGGSSSNNPDASLLIDNSDYRGKDRSRASFNGRDVTALCVKGLGAGAGGAANHCDPAGGTASQESAVAATYLGRLNPTVVDFDSTGGAYPNACGGGSVDRRGGGATWGGGLANGGSADGGGGARGAGEGGSGCGSGFKSEGAGIETGRKDCGGRGAAGAAADDISTISSSALFVESVEGGEEDRRKECLMSSDNPYGPDFHHYQLEEGSGEDDGEMSPAAVEAKLAG